MKVFVEKEHIFNTEGENINIYDAFHYKNKYYSVCSIKNDNNEKIAIVKLINFNTSGREYLNENNIRCPYCGCEDQNSWECEDEDEDEENICEKCGSTFAYERVVTVVYSSRPINPITIQKIG